MAAPLSIIGFNFIYFAFLFQCSKSQQVFQLIYNVYDFTDSYVTEFIITKGTLLELLPIKLSQ